MRKPCLLAAVVVLAGYSAPGQSASKPKSISYKQASAFERSLLARGSDIPGKPDPRYVQPANKSEACRLPTTQDQLGRPNLRVYWEGDCKNGFAFGLGRDIAISDTHHVEEITVHEGTGDNWAQPRVLYDYVANVVSYSVGGERFPAEVALSERMDNSVSGFNAYQTIRDVDESGNARVLMTSAFSPERIYVNARSEGSIGYRFTDHSAVPAANQNALKLVSEIVDMKSNVSGGIAIASYADGSARHFKVANGLTEQVLLPMDYLNHLWAKYQEVLGATSQAYARLQRAQQIEREYMFKACSGNGSIDGLDRATYAKICTWRDQFKEPYAAASANYQKRLESLKQQAVTAEQQRQIQQQIAMQQQMLQQQQIQQGWNELNQASQQLQQRTQQTLQGVNSWQAPQAQPIAPAVGNQVICHTIGSIITCR